MIKFLRDFVVPTLVVVGLHFWLWKPLSQAAIQDLLLPVIIFGTSALWFTLVWFQREAAWRPGVLRDSAVLLWLSTLIFGGVAAIIVSWQSVSTALMSVQGAVIMTLAGLALAAAALALFIIFARNLRQPPTKPEASGPATENQNAPPTQ